MRHPGQNVIKFGAILTIVIFFNSCVPYTKMLNFREESTTEFLDAQYVQDVKQIKIQKDDILAISVFTFDSTAAKVFNTKSNSANSDGNFVGRGYLVDEDGFIDFPVLGRMRLKGLTRDIAGDTIKARLLTYLRDPVVEVRFLNLHISVMGEVKKPGIYTFPDERFTLLEALAISGDLTDFADREHILIIREYEKIREFGKVDLSSARAFESPYFYLAQNDVVYVRPLKEKAKVLQDPLSRILAITGILGSIASIVIALTR